MTDFVTSLWHYQECCEIFDTKFMKIFCLSSCKKNEILFNKTKSPFPHYDGSTKIATGYNQY